jgi:hypothetical protein
MKFSQLPVDVQKKIAGIGDAIDDDIRATEVPTEGDPRNDPAWDPSVELSRLSYRRIALEQEIRTTVEDSRHRGQSWNTIGRALGTTGEAARQRYGEKADRR